MYAQNEQVHVAAWPSFSNYEPFASALGSQVNNPASRIYAVEGSCFVLAPCAVVSKAMIDELCDTLEKRDLNYVVGGHAVVYGPVTEARWFRSCRRTVKVSCTRTLISPPLSWPSTPPVLSATTPAPMSLGF
ncbi:hypothetical protein SCB29_29420 [Paraburkholderia sp. SIMBA_055]